MCLPLADSGVEKWGFVAWVGSYEQQQVTVLNAGDARVQQVVGAQVSAAERENNQLRKLETHCRDWRNTVQHVFCFILAKLIIRQSHPAPAIGKTSSVQRFSELSLLRRSLRETRASASAIPPAMAATSLPCTLCSYTHTHTHIYRHLSKEA